MKRQAQPRWKKARFGENQDLYLRTRWLGAVEPEIKGQCRYTTISGVGSAPTQEEAKRQVESAAASTLT